MSTFSSSVRPRRANSNSESLRCPLCYGDGCSIYPAGGDCTLCKGSGQWKTQRSGLVSCPRCAGSGVRPGTVACWRIQSLHKNANGAWLHPLDAETAATLPKVVDNSLPLASVEVRHEFYTKFLDGLALKASHYRHLRQVRRLSRDAICNAQFKSVPSRFDGDNLVRSVTNENPGIPGLFTTVGGKLCLHCAGINGFYIPIRDHLGRIQALQFRKMGSSGARYLMLSGAPKEIHKRASAGTPNHFIRFNAESRSVLVVEGILKAEIVAEYASVIGLGACPIVACVGTGTAGEMARQVRLLMPKLQVVWTAFDRNASGKSETDTREREAKLHRQFREWGMWTDAVQWEGEKGLDDYLLRIAK